MDSTQRVHSESALPPHALVFPFPLLGHINPLLSISQQLASTYGFKITFLTTDYRLTQLKGEKQKPKADEDIPNIDFQVVPGLAQLSADDHEGIPGVHRLLDACHDLRESGAFEEWLQELHEKKGHPLNCVISDSLLSWTQALADKLGIPRASFWACSATSYAFYSQGSLLNHPCYYKGTYYEGEKNLTLPLKILETYIHVPASVLPMDIVFKGTFTCIEMDKNCAWLMFNTSKHIESEPLQSIKLSFPNTEVLAINVSNPLLFTQARSKSCSEHLESISSYSAKILKNKEDSTCLDWLDLKPSSSVIYIAFGSIVSLDQEELQELAFGLENSKKYFLWVLRSTKKSILDDNSINDSQLLPEGFLERTNEQGLIVSWAPQSRVLAHPAIGCFLTHCGWNSIMESLSCGVPLLALPLPGFADLTLLAWYLEHVWHVGLYIPIEKLSKVEIEKIVNILMEEKNVYHQNAICMSKAVKLTTPQKELEPFVLKVIKKA